MADDAVATTDETTEPEKTTPDAPSDETLGPEGEKALKAWKERARKAEREAKAKAKVAEDAAARLAKIDEESKSEQEKAIEQARNEAADEVKKAAEEELRAERLNSAIARQAAKDFADVDDAIRLLDVGDELFDDDGKVQTDALGSALAELLERKPHLKADSGRPGGGSDAGKGEGAGPSIEEMSVEDHLRLIRDNKD